MKFLEYLLQFDGVLPIESLKETDKGEEKKKKKKKNKLTN